MAGFYVVSNLTGSLLGPKRNGEVTLVNEKYQARGFTVLERAQAAARKANREMGIDEKFGMVAKPADQVWGFSESL